MTGQIPHTFIEEVLARTDIVDIVGGRISLRKAGANFIARCPFHSEKTPSFSVSQTKQFYHCFGCGVSGDAIKFLTEHDGLHFTEAVEFLASRAGLTVPTEQKEGNTLRLEPLYAILEEAQKFYQQALRHHPSASRAHEYLKGRGLSGQIAKQFKLGFASREWEDLVKHLGTDPSRLEQLVLAGLAIKKDGRYYDRFRDRVLFPIRDRRGRVVGFGGRVLGSEGEPKYLNSPETPVFNKGNELYGLFEARSGHALTSLIVVEGYIDVVSLAQFGIKNAVATLGTSLTEKHIELLFKQVSELFFCFDGDKAGHAAALRALPHILPYMKEGRRVRFIVLPQNEDPDSYVRKEGAKAFYDLMERATPLSDFLFESLSVNLDLNHLDSRAQLISKAKPLIKLIPKGVFQQMIYDRLAELTGVESDVIQGQVRYRGDPRSQSIKNKKNISKGYRNLPPNPAARAIAMLLKNRELLSIVGDINEYKLSDLPNTSLLCAIIDILQIASNISIEDVRNRLSSEWVGHLSQSELKTITDSIPESGIEQEFLGALERLRERAQEQAMETLLRKAKQGVLSLEEKAHLKNLLEQREKNRVE